MKRITVEPPADAPYQNDGRMEFEVVSGGGGVKSFAQPDNPNLAYTATAIQTAETNAEYSAKLKLGGTPGKKGHLGDVVSEMD